MKVLMMALLLGAGAALGACSKDESTDQNVAIDINDADPADIEAVPTDETADGTAEDLADTNADLANAN